MRQITQIPRLAGIHPDAEPAIIKERIRSSANASFSISGTLSRNEVLQRAQYWVDRGFIYGQPDAPDSSGRRYRTDCAGLVSNAWRLGGSPLTNDFLANALNGVANMRVVRLDDLRSGDALVRDTDGADSDGHIALFAFWKDVADPRKGAYVYSFEALGETVRNPYVPSNFGNRGFDDWSRLTSYIPIRYNNVVEKQR
jgi:hypothetical protein